MTSSASASAFPETADIETSSDAYAGRFAGPAGQWLLDVQERITRRLLSDLPPGASILDVGGGHGQLAIPLARAGYRVTVLGSDASCRHRIREIVDAGLCTFEVGNVIDLPHPDRSFDAVIAFRLLTHCAQWPTLVKELCRVSRGIVIADYPTSQSLNAVAPALFEAKKKVEVNTRTWKLFRHAEVQAEFERQGWRLQRRAGQFFLPMVIHRMLKMRAVSAALEAACAGLGLTRLWGSPVIARWEPVHDK